MSAEFSSWNSDTQKKFITLETTEYSCLYCGRGSDSKNEVFSQGSCMHCGGPAKEYVKTRTIESLQDVGRKIVLFDSIDNKTDTNNLIEEIKSKHNIEIVRFSEMVQNDMSITERIDLAKEASRSFGMVFIVASENINLQTGKISSIAFEQARETQPEGVIKPVILLSSMDDFKYMPRASSNIAAASLNDDGFDESEFYNKDDHKFVSPHDSVYKLVELFKRSRGG